MTLSRRVPAFDAVHFESLSHEEKLKLLSEFLDALAPSQPPGNGDSQEPARGPRRAQKTT